MEFAPTLDLPGHLASLTVEISGSRGQGSGIRWPVRGVIATCSHVVHDRVITVRFHDGSEHRARLLVDDPGSDVAVLLVDDEVETPSLELRRDPVRPGELLFAMGNPWGEARVLTSGVAIAGGAGDEPLVADLRVRPGNSGGPLADARGRIAGIVSMYRGGAAVAVPIARVERLVARLDGAGRPPV